MTEYRLVPVEATREMIEAACTFETWGWGFTRELDREAAAATYAAMLSAAPPAPTREEVARAIAHAMGDDFDDAFASKAEWNATGGYNGGRFRQISEPMQHDYLDAADAILALLGRQP